MSIDDATVAEAAIAVVNILRPLTPEERERVLDSAGALYGVGPRPTPFSAGGHPAAIASPRGSDVPPAPVHTGKRVSIVEFLNQKSPATNPQRIACFAYYREKFEGHEMFASADLAPYFAQAKLAAPANFTRDYNNAVREGWIHDDGAKSYLTQNGENAVEGGFSGKGKSRGSTSGAKKRKIGKSDAAKTE